MPWTVSASNWVEFGLETVEISARQFETSELRFGFLVMAVELFFLLPDSQLTV